MPRSKSVVDNHIEEMKLNTYLTLDAWSNIKNKPIVNYMLISDSSTFFLESVPTGEQSHVAKWIAQDMGRVIDFLAGKQCKAVISFFSFHHQMTAQLQKAQLTESLPGLVQPAPTRWGFFEGVFRKLEKKVNTFCTALFLPRTLFKGTCKKKESQQKIHDIITDGKFVEFLDKAIMILNPVDTTIVVFQK
ncbi:hypothetical protein BASA61_003736 [Batrachochytrium salamandrivorans]|nr:hypothetical protein BASA61_003736 [Batrachochytrium salamandrivorans]KAH9266902.1 hypothetical protein BASA83_010255 [Batrachochytrium salamandrivorans]